MADQTSLFGDAALVNSASAVISECNRYRYVLLRAWGNGPQLVYLLVNPSTAGATMDDATVRSMRRLAAALGFNGFVVINLFAWRATNVSELLVAQREVAGTGPVGPNNDEWIDRITTAAPLIICGWGSKGGPVGNLIRERAAAVVERVRKHHDLHALRFTKDGSPEHPLYLPSTLKPILYAAKEAA